MTQPTTKFFEPDERVQISDATNWPHDHINPKYIMTVIRDMKDGTIYLRTGKGHRSFLIDRWRVARLGRTSIGMAVEASQE